MALQLALFGAIGVAAAIGPGWGEAARTPRLAVGAGLLAAGAALAVWSLRTLGSALTPLPKPRRRGDLVTNGPYRLARHPIYGGGILLCLGIALVTRPGAVAATASLTVLWDLKSRVEERWLSKAYAGYDAYRRSVRRRLVPFVY